MTVLCGSPIFGVRFCNTGVGVMCDDVAIKFWPCENKEFSVLSKERERENNKRFW